MGQLLIHDALATTSKEETCFKDFLKILKQTLQKFQKIFLLYYKHGDVFGIFK